MTTTKTAKNSQYRLYRWWKGDRFSPAQWIHSGDYRSNEQAMQVVERMRKYGCKQFRIEKVAIEDGG